MRLGRKLLGMFLQVKAMLKRSSNDQRAGRFFSSRSNISAAPLVCRVSSVCVWVENSSYGFHKLKQCWKSPQMVDMQCFPQAEETVTQLWFAVLYHYAFRLEIPWDVFTSQSKSRTALVCCISLRVQVLWVCVENIPQSYFTSRGNSPTASLVCCMLWLHLLKSSRDGWRTEIVFTGRSNSYVASLVCCVLSLRLLKRSPDGRRTEVVFTSRSNSHMSFPV